MQPELAATATGAVVVADGGAGLRRLTVDRLQRRAVVRIALAVGRQRRIERRPRPVGERLYQGVLGEPAGGVVVEADGHADTDGGTGDGAQARRRVVGGVGGQRRLQGRPRPVRLHPEERQVRGGARGRCPPRRRRRRTRGDRGPACVGVGGGASGPSRHLMLRWRTSPAWSAALAAPARSPPSARRPRASERPASATVASPPPRPRRPNASESAVDCFGVPFAMRRLPSTVLAIAERPPMERGPSGSLEGRPEVGAVRSRNGMTSAAAIASTVRTGPPPPPRRRHGSEPLAPHQRPRQRRAQRVTVSSVTTTLSPGRARRRCGRPAVVLPLAHAEGLQQPARSPPPRR